MRRNKLEKKIKIGQQFLNGFSDAINKHDTVQVEGFGEFSLVERGGYKTFIPGTDRQIKIKKNRTISFRPSEAIKRILNG
jgi:nucleoid DNA-binding protein